MGSMIEEEVVSKMSMPLPTPGRKLQIEVPSSPARSGTQTPPFHTPAAVPFRWEQVPGKPWPCAALFIVPTRPEDFAVKSLEQPPGMLNAAAITAKMPVPLTGPTLLEGQRLQAISFRLEGEDSGWGAVCKRRRIMGNAWFGSWRGRRTSSFPLLSHPKSHFWRSIYEGLKGAIPWRSRTPKKMGS